MNKKEVKLYQYRGYVKHLERLVGIDWETCRGGDALEKNVWANRAYYAVVDINNSFCPSVSADLFFRAQRAFNRTIRICEDNKFAGDLLPRLF